MKNILLLLLLLFLFGCAPKGEQIMIQNPKDSVYASGYGDGCESGRKAAGVEGADQTQNTSLYVADVQYRLGWDDGYKECRFREEKVAKLANPESSPG
jgi:hypothetical protein